MVEIHHTLLNMWVFSINIGVGPQNGWFIMENLEHSLKLDDLGVPLFSETSMQNVAGSTGKSLTNQ